MTLLQFIMAARADFMTHREPESVPLWADVMFPMGFVLIAFAMAGGA